MKPVVPGIPPEHWEDLGTENGKAQFRFIGPEAVVPKSLTWNGVEFPILPGTYFATGMTVGFPLQALKSGVGKIKATGNLVRNGQVVYG